MLCVKLCIYALAFQGNTRIYHNILKFAVTANIVVLLNLYTMHVTVGKKREQFKDKISTKIIRKK